MDPIDLGDGHTLRWMGFRPDRKLNPRWAHLGDVERYGALIEHARPDGSHCGGGITLDTPTAQEVEPDRPKWTVESWEPLTLSPSLLCHCGDHGNIIEGRWVPCSS